MQHDSTNTSFLLANELVNFTSRNIFLTGKAGTGKTTFLKYIRENCPKQMAVIAPTGVAAINAGGVTIHSFFQLPFSPFVPETKGFTVNGEVNNKHTLLGRLRLNSERRKILQELELLVIDEISMVRCDVLDAIDLILRHVRSRHQERFGGVQVLFIGDMYQLPPVIKEQEWSMLREYYQSPYFFHSHVIREEAPVYIEFTKIYRQNEELFISILNKVRNNEMDKEALEALHQRYQPDFFGEKTEGYILLTTHNEKAREINTEELVRLPGELYTYKSEVDGDFPTTAFPADEALQLKVGAQVMFIKNDTDKGRRYFNGKIGVVTELTDDKIFVQCKDDATPIEVTKEKWENIRYTLDKGTRNVSEDVLGSFSQYPLRLAWAITIHKSQGLTFDKAIIDAGKAFAPGQVYVALSRCTNLQGLVLHSRIQPHSLLTDDRIVRFTRNVLPLEELKAELIQAKKDYQEKVVLNLFEFSKAIASIKELQDYLVQHKSSFNTEVFVWADELLTKLQGLQATAEKFHTQIKSLFAKATNPDESNDLHERLKKGAAWFGGEVKTLIEIIQQSPAVTDSTMHAKEYNEILREVFLQLSQQYYLMQGIGGRFDIAAYHRRKKTFLTPSFGVNAYAGASEKKVELQHPSLYYQLKKLRDTICSKRNLPIYYVASSKTLEEMATYLPQTVEELVQISGFGKAKADTYGPQFLEIIQAYAEERNLASSVVEKNPKRKRKEKSEAKEKKPDTKAETFRLFGEGKTVTEIAEERNLTVQTIESHLAHYVATGAIKIEDLVSREKIVLIEPALQGFEKGSPLTSVKEKLPSSVGYGDIKLVLAWLDSQQSSTHINH